MTASRRFFGWHVAAAAFVVAVFGWGFSFYGTAVFLHAVHAARGWPIPVISSAITAHFLVGAGFVALLPGLHRRFGLTGTTRAAGVATALGFLGWGLATAPWQLLALAPVTGFGWAATGGAALNAMVAPWFARRRPAALGLAFNGASIGGMVFTPLWVVLIGAAGLPGALALAGAVMAGTIWVLAGHYFRHGPAAMGQTPDGEPLPSAPPTPAVAPAQLRPWRDRRFLTLAASNALSLFAQIGLLSHLFSLLVPALGEGPAGLATALGTVCAVLGRTALGWLMPPGADRRLVAAATYLLQALACLALLAAGGDAVRLLLLGVVMFGLGLGNATSLPPLIAQQDFAPEETGRVVALFTASTQASYAFAPAAFALLRDAGGAAPGLFVAATMLEVAAALVVLLGRRPRWNQRDAHRSV